MNVFILTEGGVDTGMGHISRCLSLYEAFQEINIIPNLYIKGDPSIDCLLDEYDYINADWIKINLKTIQYNDLVIIDSYNVPKRVYKSYSLTTTNVVYLDDNSRIEYPQGILLSPTNFSHLLNFQNNYFHSIIGIKYILLRKPFWDVPKYIVKKKVSRVLVSMGGADIMNITPTVCKLLNEIYFEAQVQVACNNNQGLVNVLQEFEYNNLDLNVHCSADEMKEKMFNSDLVITTGGQTLYESIRIGVPSIGISVADNQTKALQAFNESGYLAQILDVTDISIWKKFKSELIRLQIFETRKKNSKLGFSLIDGQGARRVAKNLQKLISNEK